MKSILFISFVTIKLTVLDYVSHDSVSPNTGFTTLLKDSWYASLAIAKYLHYYYFIRKNELQKDFSDKATLSNLFYENRVDEIDNNKLYKEIYENEKKLHWTKRKLHKYKFFFDLAQDKNYKYAKVEFLKDSDIDFLVKKATKYNNLSFDKSGFKVMLETRINLKPSTSKLSKFEKKRKLYSAKSKIKYANFLSQKEKVSYYFDFFRNRKKRPNYKLEEDNGADRKEGLKDENNFYLDLERNKFYVKRNLYPTDEELFSDLKTIYNNYNRLETMKYWIDQEKNKLKSDSMKKQYNRERQYFIYLTKKLLHNNNWNHNRPELPKTEKGFTPAHSLLLNILKDVTDELEKKNKKS